MKNEKELRLYRVFPRYIDALQDIEKGGDSHVYNVRDGKEHRPFVGIITTCNNKFYCIPLSGYKTKYKVLPDNDTFMKIIIDGKIVGALQFSRMIPVEERLLKELDLQIHKHDTKKQQVAKELRRKETEWCNEHKQEIIDKCRALYNTYITGNPFKGRKHCLDFIKMEILYEDYIKKHPKSEQICTALKPF